MAVQYKFTNTGLSTLVSGIDSSQTTLNVTVGHGSRFPSANFQLVIWNSTDFANPIEATDREIVRCTSRSGDVLTITRGQEGTSGTAHNTGGKTYSVALAITKAILDNLAYIPSGTVMVFFQAAPPAGWTQVTTQNDKALRVVSGTGGGTGGSTVFTSAWAAKNADAEAAHTHTGPSHSHSLNTDGNSVGYDAGNEVVRRTSDGRMSVEAAGTDAAYITNITDSTGTGATGAGASHQHNITVYSPQYIDMIIASRD